MPGLRLAIDVFLYTLGLFLMWRVLFRRQPGLRKQAAEYRRRISVIVPARNEAQRINQLLISLKEQNPKPFEIIVVDDDSSDGTGAVAREAGVQVIEAEPLPEGWSGKAWACWQGAKASTGDILLFLDADTWLAAEGIGRIIDLYEGSGLLSLQPYHVTVKAYEQLSAFFNIVMMAAVGAFTPLGRRIRPGGAFGACMLCSREDYFHTGGHQAVRGELLEDIPLGKIFLRHNLPVRCQAGKGSLFFRMYPGGLGELIEGWTKGMAYGASAVNPIFSILTVAWIAGCFEALSLLVVFFASLGTSPAWAGLIIYALYAFAVGCLLRQVGRFKWWTSIFYPLPLSFFVVIVLRSLLSTYLFRRVVWKGRTIHTSSRRR